MALSNSRFERLVTLCGLYVAQGIPWGFMLISLPAYLSDKYGEAVVPLRWWGEPGVTDTDIGNLTAIILVPWSFKLIWAPIMDTFTLRSMGRRRSWIIGSELMMAATLLAFILVAGQDLSAKLTPLVWMYFVHNCFASLQDVCTDALAVDILPEAERGQTNGLMWGSKLVGKGLGAAGLSLVLNAEWGGLGACVAIQIALLMLIMIIPIVFLERPGEKRMPWSQGQAMGDSSTSAGNFSATFVNWFRAFTLPTMIAYLVFTLSKLLGSGINEIVTKTLYTQQLDWDDVEFSAVAGFWATGPIILGAVGGGYLADRFGRRLILAIGFGGFGLAAIVFALGHGYWDDRTFATSYIIVSDSLNAVASVGFLSLAMKISWSAAAATVFTTYMTLSNVSHIIGNKLAGPVREYFKYGADSAEANMHSYMMTFWTIGVLSLLPLVFLLWVRPREVEAAEQRRLAAGTDEGPNVPPAE